MRKRNTVTRLEWEILEIVWQIGGSVSVRDVLETGYPNDEKAYTTIQTVMNKLVDKGVLQKRKTGLVNFYSCVRERNDLVKSEMNSFVQRVFGGSPGALVTYLVESGSIDESELRALKKQIRRSTR